MSDNTLIAPASVGREVIHEVIPAILEKDWPEIERKLQLAKSFAHTIHIDIIDGKFAPNATFLDPEPFKKFSKDFFLELHMMVEEPIEYLEKFSACGFQRFIGHVESMFDPIDFVAKGQLYGEVGLAIDGPTSIDELGVPLDDLDCLLIMTVKAGVSGQAFVPEYLEKVKAIRKKSPLPIIVDGGINKDTIELCKSAGATRFAASSAIFTAPNPAESYQTLSTLATSPR